MGFYNDKLNKYSKEISFSPEQLEETKQRIIEEKKNYIEALRKDMQLSRRSNLDGEYEYEQEQDAYMMAVRELDFVQTMNTPEFYQYMISVENYTLSKIEDKAFTDMANNIKTMSKYKSQKGLVGKASALFGIDRKMIDKNSKQFEENNHTADYTQNAHKEWQAISPENQALYIAGRFEIDGKISFDKEGFEANKLEAFNKEQSNIQENGMEL